MTTTEHSHRSPSLKPFRIPEEGNHPSNERMHTVIQQSLKTSNTELVDKQNATKQQRPGQSHAAPPPSPPCPSPWPLPPAQSIVPTAHVTTLHPTVTQWFVTKLHDNDRTLAHITQPEPFPDS